MRWIDETAGRPGIMKVGSDCRVDVGGSAVGVQPVEVIELIFLQEAIGCDRA